MVTKTTGTIIDATEARATGGELCAAVVESSGQPALSCYQCQRCGGGCPVAVASGTTPSDFLRLLSLGLAEEARKSPLLWLCAGCGTCGARCPNRISTNEVIDELRAVTAGRGSVAKGTGDIPIFHQLFLKQIQYLGRQHELFLIGALKIRTRKFLKDVDLGYQMFRKGKLPLLPHKASGIPAVRSIFKARAGARKGAGER